MKKTTTHFKIIYTVLALLLGFNVHAQIVTGDLKQLANNKNVYIGNIANGGFIGGNFSGNANNQFTNEYNVMVTENAFKPSSLIGGNNVPASFPDITISDINTDVLDKVMKYSEDKNLRLRGHALVWFNVSSKPQWFDKVNWTADNVYRFSKSYITAVVNHTKGRVDEWDVLNEAIQDGNGAFRPDDQVWYSAVRTQTTSNNITESGQLGFIDYFANLFKWARAADPACKLFYNDFSINGTNVGKADFMFQMVKDLQAKGAPINGVGFQSHMTVKEFDSNNFINQVRTNMQRLADIGLDVAITEADIRSCTFGNETNLGNTEALTGVDDQRQAFAYRDYVQLVLEQPNCNTFLVWGQTDDESWISSSQMQSVPGFIGCHRSTLHNGDYSAKFAYQQVREVVSNLAVQTAEQPVVNDAITSTTAPSTVTPGTNARVSVNYTASTNRDIIVYFQEAVAPFTVIAQTKIDVSSGSRTNNIDIAIPANLALGNDLYQFNTIITTNGGDYSSRFDEDPKGGVDAINNASAFKTSAQFDFGTINSPVFNGYTRVHKNTRTATYGWTRSLALNTKDRGTPNVNNLNRDFVFSRYARTFETSVENGTWEVKITSGDIFKHDDMQIKAEGKTKVSNFTVDANKYVNQIFYVLVEDGKLSLEFSDQGGSDQNWVINRVVLTKRDLPNEFKFDLGTINSPVFNGYTRVHKNTRKIGYRWTNSVALSDKNRGSAGGQNTLNRDFVYSRYKRTFETNVENGLWDVLVTFGDIYKHDNMRVRCEGVVKLDNITNNENQYFNRSFTITVRDGLLTLEFSDEGGSDVNWAVSRIILKKINSSTQKTKLTEHSLEEVSTNTSINTNISTSDSNFVIYPNPAKNTMQINLGIPVTSATVNIFDTMGRIIKTVTIEDNDQAIDIASIPAGIYFIQIKNGDKTYQKSLIKN